MSAANHARSASARATIAARMLLSVVPTCHSRRRDGGLSRGFDDCFENGDGGEVHRILIDRARSRPELRAAMRAHHYESWADMAEQPAPPRPMTGNLFSM